MAEPIFSSLLAIPITVSVALNAHQYLVFSDVRILYSQHVDLVHIFLDFYLIHVWGAIINAAVSNLQLFTAQK